MDRRSFLKLSGALTIVVGSGEVWRLSAQDNERIGDKPELEPWRSWRDDLSHGPLLLVRAAILSSNAYNSQPWMFVVNDDQIAIFADVNRNLGDFDPYLREMFFSLGCALENLELAGSVNGYGCSTELIHGTLSLIPQEAHPVLAATTKLDHAKPQRNELYDAIPHRHTNREPFDETKPLTDSFLAELGGLTKSESQVKIFLFTDPAELQRIVELISSASGKFLADPQVRKGTLPWLRHTTEEMRKFRDGFLLDAQASRYGTLEAYAHLMRSGRVFGLIAVRDRYDRAQTIRAGQIWQRSHLLATARGVAARPANGAIEIIDHERQRGQRPETTEALASFTHDKTWQPTFMFYMGYPTVPAEASPRRPLESVLLRSIEQKQ